MPGGRGVIASSPLLHTKNKKEVIKLKILSADEAVELSVECSCGHLFIAYFSAYIYYTEGFTVTCPKCKATHRFSNKDLY